MRKQENLQKPEEIAKVLNVARKTIVTWAREGRLPCVRIGRSYRFDPDAIAQWIAQNRRP